MLSRNGRDYLHANGLLMYENMFCVTQKTAECVGDEILLIFAQNVICIGGIIQIRKRKFNQY
jgi:hypothetical protein